MRVDQHSSPSEDIPKSASPIMVYGGAILGVFTERIASGLCARQRYDLDRFFYFTGLMMLVERPGYMIDVVLSRGALK